MIQGRKVNSSPIHALRFAKNSKYKFYRADKEFYYLPVERVKQVPRSRLAHNLRTLENIYLVPFIVHRLGFEGSLTDDFGSTEVPQ